MLAMLLNTIEKLDRRKNAGKKKEFPSQDENGVTRKKWS